MAAIAAAYGMRTLVEEERALEADREATAEMERRVARDVAIAAELIAMGDADQAIRGVMFGTIPDPQPWTPERGKELNAERERLDHEHVLRLAEIIDELGDWPTISRFDALASHSACGIASHGLKDMEFMARAQAMMEPHVRTGDVDVNCWAQVTDRLLVHRGELQLYGTQMRSGEVDGIPRWGVAPVFEPEKLLERRTEIGLSDYPEYLAKQRQTYRVPDSVLPYPDEPAFPGVPSGAPN